MSEKTKTYKASLERLQAIVAQLEEGTEDLEELQALVKEASELLAYCQKALRTAEGDLDKALKAIDED